MTISDYQQIVAWIQGILTSEADPADSVLRDAAREYDQAVQEVNKRLRECDQYQRTGHRSEALQLAESDPNLLESVRVLDFPELATWIDYLSQFQVLAAPILLIDIAAELSDAYIAAQPLEKWLRMHRTYALGRRDLKARSHVLRQLKQFDTTNAIWDADLKTYEAERLKELKAASDTAVAKRDVEQVAEIETELTSTPWSVETPAKLIQRVRQAHDRLRREAARQSLYELAHKLSDAFGALDVAHGKQHLQRWMALDAIADLSPDDEIRDLAAPALDWLNEIARREQEEADFNSAIRALTEGLDHGVDRTALERQFHQVSRFGRDVPNILMQRVMERRHALDVRASRRGLFVVGISVVSVMCLVALTVYMIQWRSFTQEVARHSQQLDAQIQAENLTEARNYLDSLEKSDPTIHRSPAIAGLAATLGKAEELEQGRVEQFSQLIAHAREVGLDHPSWESFEPAFAELKRAEAIVKSPADEARVKEVERDLTRERNRLQKETDAKFQADLNNVMADIKSVSKESPVEHVNLLTRLGELQLRPHVSDVFRAPLPELSERVKQQMAAVERDLLTAQHLGRIADSIGQRKKFVEALRKYALEQAGTTRGADFSRVADKEIKLWDGIEGWAQIRDRWKRENLTTITPERARELMDEYQKLTKETPYPGKTGLEEKVQWCNSVMRRKLPAGSGVLDAIDKLLDSAEFKELYVIETSDGKRYYTNEVPETKGTALNVRYYVDLDLEQKRLIKLPLSQVPAAKSNTTPRSWLSPQSHFRDQAIKLVKTSTVPWEEMFAQLVKLLQEDTQMDPILKVKTLGQLLHWGSTGSVFLAASLKTQADILNAGRLPVTTNWLSPNDPAIEKLRSQAKAALSVIVSQKKNFEDAIVMRDKTLETRLGPALRWVGWVRRERAEWFCALKPLPSGLVGGDLIVIHVGIEPDSQPVWAKVGELEQGHARVQDATFTSGPQHLRVEGRPVFLAVDD